MDIPLFQPDETLRFERIVLYPYPDLKRIWTRIWLTAVADMQPNVEITVYNPNGSENNGVYMLLRTEPRIETTLHMRDPVPGAMYRVVASLTLGLSSTPELLDSQEFDLVLEFRDPDKRESGFGIGVDWEKLQSDAQGL